MLQKSDLPEFFQPAIGHRNTAIVSWILAGIVFTLLMIVVGSPTIPARAVAATLIVMMALTLTGFFSWLIYKRDFLAPYSWLLSNSGVEQKSIVAMDRYELRRLAKATLSRLAEKVNAAEAAYPGNPYHSDRVTAMEEFENGFDAMNRLMLIQNQKGRSQFFRQESGYGAS